MTKELITPWEVVKYGPVKNDYPTEYICPHIKRTELLCFRKCYLGIDFYNRLVKDLTDTTADEYSANTTYAEGDLICYEGCILKSTKDANDVHPADDPDGCWIVNPKFETPIHNELWDCHLARLLAFKVLYTSIRYSTYQAGAKGLTMIFSDDTGVQTVGDKAFAAYKKELAKDAQDELILMFEWLVETQKMHEGFSFGILEVDNKCGCGPVCVPPKKSKQRRFYFRR